MFCAIKNTFFWNLLLAVMLLPNCALAANVDRQATELYETVMSPYCPGVTLSSCASSDATTLRNEIYSWLQGGASIEEIKGRLSSRFGSNIFGVPKRSGIGFVAWIAPFVAILIGLSALLLYFRSGKGRLTGEVNPQFATGSDSLSTELSKETTQKIDQEFKKYLTREVS